MTKEHLNECNVLMYSMYSNLTVLRSGSFSKCNVYTCISSLDFIYFYLFIYSYGKKQKTGINIYDNYNN